jgi:cobalt/nickel transport protein
MRPERTLKSVSMAALVVIFSLVGVLDACAHFGMIIPDEDIVESQDGSNLGINIMFAHPFEGMSMEMAKPAKFGVLTSGNKEDLTDTLKLSEIRMHADDKPFKAWKADYRIKGPGDHIFYVEPAPYWEPAEDCYIVHYTKVIVDAYGKEDAWDSEIGLKTEIIPLTRPYGLYAGNTFQGIVKVNGKAAPYSEVEIEYYNEQGEYTAPKAPFVTQVVKCDAEGKFTYTMPVSGWWGFAALNEDDDRTIEFEGEQKAVEIGAVLWVRTRNME